MPESASGGVYLVLGGVLSPGGVYLVLGGVCSPRGLLLGGVCSRGVSVPRGCLLGGCGIPACTEADTPRCGQTHACKNITLATTSLRPVINPERFTTTDENVLNVTITVSVAMALF